MADNIDFDSLADFATLSMMPTGDEEVNAIWARKLANNSGKAIGEWGTVILNETTITNLGSARFSFPSGFSNMPSFDVFQFRGGTQVAFNIPGVSIAIMADNAFGILGLDVWVSGGTDIRFNYYSDHRRNGRLGTFLDAGGRDQYGTFMYRFRGW